MIGDVVFHESFVGSFSLTTIAEDADVFVGELGDFHSTYATDKCEYFTHLVKESNLIILRVIIIIAIFIIAIFIM